MSKFEKLLEKKRKGGKELSENEQKAKMSVVKHLKDIAGSEMSERLKGLKNVSVASNSKEGLESGLTKAKEIVSKMGDDQEEKDHDHLVDAAENPLDEAMESPEQEAMEHLSPEHMDEAALDAKLEELMKMKESLKARKKA